MAVLSNGERQVPFERHTLAMSSSQPGVAIHAGEPGFADGLKQHCPMDESAVAERLVDFKARLRDLSGEEFWSQLMTGMTEICHAQYGFVSKRILVDDQHTAVEMPPIGEEGSCLMGVALYYNDGKDIEAMHHNYKYYAWSAPCAYMKHDKVFLVPNNLSGFIPENPNALPFQPDAYLGVPLFAEGKCYAHFGMMWTNDGLEQKENLSWTFVEMLMHSLEDLISERLLRGQGFAKESTPEHESRKVIPRAAITAAQSLRPYARSLSHELRTPMQGVIGMLDVMYATVQEQIEAQSNRKVQSIFIQLKEDIEIVQDSSKRAIEAADNVVQAYDLNMQVPETPAVEFEPSLSGQAGYFDVRPGAKPTDVTSPTSVNKRRRSEDLSWNFGNATKIRRDMGDNLRSPRATYGSALQTPPAQPKTPSSVPDGETPQYSHTKRLRSPGLHHEGETGTSTPVLKHSNIREIVPLVVHDSLRVGGRPDSVITEPLPLGERIEIRTRSSNGHVSQKAVEWIVDADVPEMMPLDGRDMSKLISALVLNAVKFTDSGTVSLHVRLGHGKGQVLVDVCDTGIGIPEDFQPDIFKPFTQEDDSLTRAKEGLGLGLLVAKGLARKVGGDLVLVRSNVDGPQHGSEFQLRIPMDSSENTSRAATPLRPSPESTPARPESTPRVRFEEPGRSTPLQKQTRPEVVQDELFLPPAVDTKANVPRTAKAIPLALPRSSSSKPRPTATNREAWDSRLAEKHPLNIMIAEDNYINRKLLLTMLTKFGYKNVLQALDGKEAVQRVEDLIRERKHDGQTNGTKPRRVVDVVLMDLWMPRLDGYKATEEILKLYQNGESGNIGRPPVIVAVTADATDEAKRRADNTGMTGYMTKPYKMPDLQRLILEHCV